ncbi:glycosyltransferase [Aquirufa sp. OSTEICH-129V]|uniref:Glycosyltransferase n=1 Tax=Aquirufa avitistagni TaxID=3104728 RepID=A0ABW6DBN0_9BACT
MKVLEVLHIATYESLGGAARATKRVYLGLQKAPIICHMFTMLKSSDDESIQVVQPKDPRAQLKYIHALLQSNQKQKLNQNVVLESGGDVSAGIVDEINEHPAPIVHLHWINNLLSISDIGKINKPIVWTLHDMWPFSGREHLSYDPDAYFYKDSTKVSSEDTLRLKIENWAHKNFKIVAPSHWLANCAKRSILFNQCDVSVIPCPIDHVLWSPQNTHSSRLEFNFDHAKHQILFLGQNLINDTNKGWDLLQAALAILSQGRDIEFELVVVGHSGEILVDCPYKIHSLGEISDDEILIQLYSTVDLLVVPSRFEAFSQVTLEAQSCGLPVIGFDIGGIPDILIHKKTGWISPAYDLIDFAEGIHWILSVDGRAEQLGKGGRTHAIENFSSERVAQLYMDLYQQVIFGGKSELKIDLDDKL